MEEPQHLAPAEGLSQEVKVARREAQAASVQQISLPAGGDLRIIFQSLQVHPLLLCLSLQVREELLTLRKGLVVLEEMTQL